MYMHIHVYIPCVHELHHYFSICSDHHFKHVHTKSTGVDIDEAVRTMALLRQRIAQGAAEMLTSVSTCTYMKFMNLCMSRTVKAELITRKKSYVFVQVDSQCTILKCTFSILHHVIVHMTRIRHTCPAAC